VPLVITRGEMFCCKAERNAPSFASIHHHPSQVCYCYGFDHDKTRTYGAYIRGFLLTLLRSCDLVLFVATGVSIQPP
jgi:hypothetical protein